MNLFIVFCRINRQLLLVPAQSVHVPITVGSIVSFSYSSYSKGQDIPANPIIFRVHQDIIQKDSFSSSKHHNIKLLNGMFIVK